MILKKHKQRSWSNLQNDIMQKTFFSIAFIFFFGIHSKAQIKDTDTFIQELFNSFQTMDEKRFIDLYPDAIQLKSILFDLMQRQTGNDTAALQLGKNMLNEITDSSLYLDYAKEFRRAMDSAKVAGVNWADAKFMFSQADTSVAEDIEGKMLRGMIYFTSNKKDYFISFYEVLWPRVLEGWVGASIRNIGEMKHPEDE